MFSFCRVEDNEEGISEQDLKFIFLSAKASPGHTKSLYKEASYSKVHIVRILRCGNFEKVLLEGRGY